MRPVPVLAYHHVNKHKGDMVTVVPEVFEKQMQYFNSAGYRTLRAGELLSFINGEISLDEKAVMITFDDGWLDNYVYAFPVLRKYNINATVFITTDWISGGPDNISDVPLHIPKHREAKRLIEQGEGHNVVLNWELIREMSESGLVEFCSHTKSHRKCHNLSEDELKEELVGSKEILEEKLGRPCIALCWPFGRNNDLSVKVARENGYSLLFTTRHGVVKEGSDPFSINRIAVKDSIAWFRKTMTIYTNPILSRIYLKLKKK